MPGKRMPVAAAVFGGLDPSAGAGVLIDKLMLDSNGCLTYVIPTSLTSQNSRNTGTVWPVDKEVLKEMTDYILEEQNVEGVKTGLAGSIEAVGIIRDFILKSKAGAVVTDPVFRSSAGVLIADENVRKALEQDVFPLSSIVVFNLEEAQYYSKINIVKEEDVIKAGNILLQKTRSVLITGGHLPFKDVRDYYFSKQSTNCFSSKREGREVRGTGCAFASLILAYLLHGSSQEAAIEKAKERVTLLIRDSVKIGQGFYQMTAKQL